MSTYYVDHGMAWCAVAGGFIANVLLGGLAKSYGLIMEAYQEEFQSGSVYLLLAGGLIYTLMYCLSLPIHYACERYGSRPVVVIGALGSCISLAVASFSPNIGLWVLAVGVGVGASLSCIYFTVLSVVGRCFKRYVSVANGINVAGVSVGQMAFPALLTYLNEVYGIRAGTLIMSAVCLHLLITAALMPRYIVDPENPVRPVTPTTKTDKCRQRHKGLCSVFPKCCTCHWSRAKSRAPTYTLVPTEVNTKNTGDLDRLYTELVPMNTPPQPMGDVPRSKESIPDVPLTVDSKCLGSVTALMKKHDSQLCNALLVVYIVAKIFGDIGDVSVSFVAPTHGSKLGLDQVTVSRAITVSGAVDLVARIGIGWLTDRPCCLGKRGVILASVWIIEGLNAMGFANLKPMQPGHHDPPLSLLIGFYVHFGIHGMCSGTAMTQMIVVLIDWVGSAGLARSLAITMVVLGLVISPGQFAIGYIADATNSFVWPLRTCFIILLLAGGFLLMEFPVRWIFSRRHQRTFYVDKSNGCSGSTVVHQSQLNSDIPLIPHLSNSLIEAKFADRDIHTRGTALLQPGVGPVPAHLASSVAESLDQLSTSLFVSAEDLKDDHSSDENIV